MTQEPIPNSPWPKASVVLIVIAGIWGLLAPWLGHMGPPWPCTVAGAALLIAAAVLRMRPGLARGCGVIVVIVGGALALLGSGSIIPGAIAIGGGVAAVTWRA